MVERTSKHPNMALDCMDLLPCSKVWLWYGQCSFKLELKHSDISLQTFEALDIFISMSLLKCLHKGAILDVCLVRKAFPVHTYLLFGQSRSDSVVFIQQKSLKTDSLGTLGRSVSNMHVNAMLG